MYLTSATLVPYLIDRSILSAAELLDDDITILEAGRRNRNFKVSRRDGSGIFVKQVPLIAVEMTQSVKREATLYALVESTNAADSLKALMPKLLHYDKHRHLLAVELVPNSKSLTFYQMQVAGVAGAMEDIAAQLGRLLSCCHKQSPDILAEPSRQGIFPAQPPWILNFSHYGETMMPNMSGGAKAVLAAVRGQPGLKEHMSRLQSEWSRTCLIHGDLKWENLLIAQDPSGHRATLQLIDWELADLGDAAWDVACVLASFMQPVIVGRFDTQGRPTGPATADEVSRAQACCRTFWQTYMKELTLTLEQQALAKQRCVRFAAARLVLTAYEIAQSSAEISPSALLAIQTASSIFTNPGSAAEKLFALEETGAEA